MGGEQRRTAQETNKKLLWKEKKVIDAERFRSFWGKASGRTDRLQGAAGWRLRSQTGLCVEPG